MPVSSELKDGTAARFGATVPSFSYLWILWCRNEFSDEGMVIFQQVFVETGQGREDGRVA